MKTKKYITLSAAAQIMALTIIVINGGALSISLIYYYLIAIERKVTVDFNVTYYSFGIYVLCANIILGMFSNCVVTLGSKNIMRGYMKIMAVSWAFIAATTVYFYYFYMIFFGNALLQQADILSGSYAAVLPVSLQHIPKLDTLAVIKGEFIYILNMFSFVQGLTLVAILVLTAFVKGMINVQLFVEKTPKPSLIAMSRHGLNTSSLRDRNVIEMASAA